MNFRTRSSRILALLVLAGTLAVGVAQGPPAAAFTVNAPNLPQITGNPSSSPTEESASPTPGVSASVPGAPGKGHGAARTTGSTGAPLAPGAASTAGVPTRGTSSSWPLIILLSVCGVGVILIGLFFWSRRED